ncbi:MAG: fumarylacetoacetate hydrolase family protein, partial [Candidatus Scalindua sp.]
TTLVQSANMNEMIFNIPTLITFLSKRIPITRGDIIFTGTPDGVGPLYEGDQLTLGLGDKIKGRFSVITGE